LKTRSDPPQKRVKPSGLPKGRARRNSEGIEINRVSNVLVVRRTQNEEPILTRILRLQRGIGSADWVKDIERSHPERSKRREEKWEARLMFQGVVLSNKVS